MQTSWLKWHWGHIIFHFCMKPRKQKTSVRQSPWKIANCWWNLFFRNWLIRRAGWGLTRRGGAARGRGALLIESLRSIMGWLIHCCMSVISCLGYISRVGILFRIVRSFLILFNCSLICSRMIVYSQRCRRSSYSRFIMLLISLFDAFDFLLC